MTQNDNINEHMNLKSWFSYRPHKLQNYVESWPFFLLF